jgi:hypothetical protein
MVPSVSHPPRLSADRRSGLGCFQPAERRLEFQWALIAQRGRHVALVVLHRDAVRDRRPCGLRSASWQTGSIPTTLLAVKNPVAGAETMSGKGAW